jgi:urea transport system substrate-binding protein
MVGVNLTGAQLNSVDFRGAKMKGVRLANANLSGAVLSGADLSGAQISNSQLAGAWLNLAVLIGANLSNTDLSGSSMIAANLASADLADSNLVGSNLIGANLKGANLRSTDLRDASLDLSKLDNEDIDRDSVLAELNELRRSQVLVDAQVAGASFDSQTLWPESPITQRLITEQAEVSAIVSTASERFNVGVLYSRSGPMASSEGPIGDAILLAIDEINANGGVFGQMLEPVVEDVAGTPALFVEKAHKLLEEDQVVAIFGASTSQNRKAVIPVIEEANTLLFYPAAYEGFEQSPNTFYLGAEPSQQVIPAIDYLVKQGVTTFLLVGSDGLYSHTVNKIIKEQLGAVDLVVVGEVYVADDAMNIAQVIDQLQSLQPAVIVNSIQGDANLTFFRMLNEAGLTAQDLPVLNLTIGEEEIRLIGPELMVGHLIAATYFQTSMAPGNAAFVNAFKAAYGEERVVSDAMASAYSAVYLWKELVETAKSTAATEIRKAFASQSIEQATPRGLLRMDITTQHAFLTAHLGIVRQDGLIDIIYMSEAPLQPDPYLTQFEWARSVAEGFGE